MFEPMLSVQKELAYLAHVYEKHEHCTSVNCQICDGGLAICTVCGGFEGSLLDSCPGARLTPEQHDWNYQKFLSESRRALAAYQRERRGY